MKYAALSLFVLLTTPAFSKDIAVVDAAAKPAKIFYRCESRGLDFDTSSQMKEVSPGKYSLKVTVAPTAATDNCVVSVVDDESSAAELSYMDLFPSLDKDEAAVTEKSYSLAANHRLNSFKVDYKTAGSHLVTFDQKSATLRVQEGKTPVLATIK